MRSWPEYSNFFLSLLVIINPILAVPLFLGYTRGQSPAERRRTALTTSATVLAALVVAALTGEGLLRVFGTSLGSFRAGGGIVLFLMALGGAALGGAVSEVTRRGIEDSRQSAYGSYSDPSYNYPSQGSYYDPNRGY